MPELKDPYQNWITSWCAMVSAICYPDKPEMHAFFLDGIKSIVVTLMVMLRFANPSRENPTKFTEFAVRAGSFPRDLDHLAENDDEGRMWACRTVIAYLALYEHDPKKASRSRAFDFLMRRYGKCGKGERTLETHWSRYKSIAPLLAAFSLFDSRTTTLLKAMGSNPGKSFSEEMSIESLRALNEDDVKAIKTVASAIATEDHDEIAGEIENNGSLGLKILNFLKAMICLPNTMLKIMATARAITLKLSQCYPHSREKLGKPFLSLEDAWTFSDKLNLPDVSIHVPKLSEKEVAWL